MTSNHYIIDSSSLIELNRHNPLDVFPSVWEKLELLIGKGVLISPKEVLYEIIENDDQLAKWAKKQNNLFKDPTQKQIEILKKILKEYPSLVKEYRRHDADAWVIAMAVDMTTNSQKTLTPVKRIVVTEETLRGDRIKIPFVCQKYSIESISIVDMFRVEGWKF